MQVRHSYWPAVGIGALGFVVRMIGSMMIAGSVNSMAGFSPGVIMSDPGEAASSLASRISSAGSLASSMLLGSAIDQTGLVLLILGAVLIAITYALNLRNFPNLAPQEGEKPTAGEWTVDGFGK